MPSTARRAPVARAACRYWLDVFPRARREVHRWRGRARAIPDPVLSEIALETIRAEQRNLEGAAAFAAFVPAPWRADVVRTVVAFQALYDFVDTLVEQPADDPIANGRALHEALLVAVTPGRPHPDYYAHHPRRVDGGYLRELVDRCRDAFARLPSHAAVQLPLHRAVRRMIAYQTLIHGDGALAHAPLAAWARRETPAGSELRWWETAAGGASSLVAFALIAAAAQPSLSAREAAAVKDAYFPWIGALHVLLDSLVDRPQDAAAGHHSIVGHYRSPEETAARMDAIAATALRAAQALPDGEQHALLLAAMAGFYLSARSARLPHAAAATERITATLGDLARPVLLVHRVRQAVGRLLTLTPDRWDGRA
jgi:tetraprenyl-beta-curcumene synthase